MTKRTLDHLLREVAVIGAAGKMGSGIALLLLLEQTRLEIQNKQHARLVLIDPKEEALDQLRSYLKKQVIRYAEKQINSLRQWYANNPLLVSNEEVIDSFTETAMSLVHRATSNQAAHSAHLIFEAAPESIDLKTKLLSDLAVTNEEEALFFTNTSSIPIGELEQAAGLKGRLVGFHFYNPPAVQKLLELITTEATPPELQALSVELAERLGKTVVLSKDIAGFIGNGHFLREIHHACQEVQRLQQELSWQEAIYAVNTATEQFLIRPMGIFQLVDYVGLDVVCAIAEVMNRYGKAGLDVSMLQKLLDTGVKGGQNSDGTQKDGIFGYEKMKPVALYDLESGSYQPLEGAAWVEKMQKWLGNPPEGHKPWKVMGREKEKEKLLEEYFVRLKQGEGKGTLLALQFLEYSGGVVDTLVEQGVAANGDAVETVLKNGFYHLYSPHKMVQKEVSR